MDVTDASFQTDVVEKSHTTPVLVDFWAEWCGPCRMYTPILERVVGETNGEVVLAKVNVDENQQLAAQFRVQGIPSVKIFKDGELVSESTGAQPEAVVREMVDSVLPTEADNLAARGDEASLREALELDRSHLGATLGLARLLFDRDELDEALELLNRVPGSDEVDRLRAELEIRRVSEQGADADDPGAAAIASGDYESALDHYLEAVRAATDDETRDAAREAVLRIFKVLGEDDPLTKTYRPQLASALF